MKVRKVIFVAIFIMLCGMGSFVWAMIVDPKTTETVTVLVTPTEIVKSAELSGLRSSFGEKKNDPNELFIYLEKISGIRNGSECILRQQLDDTSSSSQNYPLPVKWFKDKKGGDQVRFKEHGVDVTVVCEKGFKEELEVLFTKDRFKEVLEALKKLIN